MDPKLAVYLAYAVVTLALTLWVGHTLQRHGQAFLRDVLPTGELAAAVTKFLVVGFYLLNLGYMAIAMKTYDEVTGPVDAVERSPPRSASSRSPWWWCTWAPCCCSAGCAGRCRDRGPGRTRCPRPRSPSSPPTNGRDRQADDPRRLTPAA